MYCLSYDILREHKMGVRLLRGCKFTGDLEREGVWSVYTVLRDFTVICHGNITNFLTIMYQIRCHNYYTFFFVVVDNS